MGKGCRHPGRQSLPEVAGKSEALVPVSLLCKNFSYAFDKMRLSKRKKGGKTDTWKTGKNNQLQNTGISDRISTRKPLKERKMKETCRVLALALIIATSATLAFAQSNAPQFVPFGNFMESTRTAGADKALLAPGSQVRDASAFEEMRQAILDRYEGVEVAHSFVIDGMHYDCVPMYQQPAVRTYGLTSIATPPPELPHNRLVDPAGNVRPATQLDAEKPFDDYGNAVACEADTVPSAAHHAGNHDPLRHLAEVLPERRARGNAWRDVRSREDRSRRPFLTSIRW